MKPFGRTMEDQRAYDHGSYAPEFDATQPGRIDLVRMHIEQILLKDLTRRPIRIVDLGCGAGDTTGPYSGTKIYSSPRGVIHTTGIEVVGIDWMPDAERQVKRRFPSMKFFNAAVEEVEAVECDLLVMTEFLEHVADPRTLTARWMAKANWALIGHPLNEPDPPFEKGHAWSYNFDDFISWFGANGFNLWAWETFPMGPYQMILGHGSRNAG